MNDELIELGRRAVACEGWRWMEGMKTLDGSRVGYVDEDAYIEEWEDEPELNRWIGITVEYQEGLDIDALPDLSDPATLGCLLALPREVCSPVVFRDAVARCFGVIPQGERSLTKGDRGIAAEYLVAALEAGGSK